MSDQHLDCVGVEAHSPLSALGLRLARDELALDLRDRLADADDGGFEVDVVPPQADRLAAAQPGRDDELPERSEGAFVGGPVEEQAGLLG